MKRIILIAVILAVAIGGYYAYSIYDEKTPDIVNREADISVEATDLIAAFDQDTASATRKYLDKIIEVKGTVLSIDTTGSIIMGEEGDPSSVVVGFDRRHMKDYEQLQPGKKTVIQGRCSGYSKGDGGDLLSSLGTTVEISFAGVKN